MRCPKCGCENLKVVDSRPSESIDAIRRRRECENCGFRFTTYERREEMPLVVIKKVEKRELRNSFLVDKVFCLASVDILVEKKTHLLVVEFRIEKIARSKHNTRFEFLSLFCRLQKLLRLCR